MQQVRLTPKTRLVLTAFHEARGVGGGRLYGYQITRRTGIPPAQVYPVLKRLHDAGLLTYEWGPNGTGTPSRRYATLMPHAWPLAAEAAATEATWRPQSAGAKS